MSVESRPYRKRRRAELEQRTRERITEAAVRLHGSVGPARTTVSAIAKEAGVQRATVYRHFPTDEALFAACSSHWVAANPAPDPQGWAEVREPRERLRRALAELYAWFAANEAMLDRTSRDAPLVPAMAGAAEGMRVYVSVVTDVLLRGRSERGAARRRAAAAVGHAASFATWQSLTCDQGLDDGEAVDVMAAMVEAAGAARRRP